MDEPTTDVIQGTLDMLILKTLSLEPMHGFGIARRVEQISRGVFKVNPGSLLTALQRLERAGWLDAEWRQTENSRRAKFYTLTRAGRKQLEAETADWTRRAVGDRAPAQGGRLADVRSGASSRAALRVLDESNGRRPGRRRRSAALPRPGDRRGPWRAGSRRTRRGAPPGCEVGNPAAVREQVRGYGWENTVEHACSPICVTPRAGCAPIPASRRSPCSRWRSASAPRPPSSARSIRSCSSRCPIRRPDRDRDDLGRRAGRLAHRRHLRHVSANSLERSRSLRGARRRPAVAADAHRRDRAGTARRTARHCGLLPRARRVARRSAATSRRPTIGSAGRASSSSATPCGGGDSPPIAAIVGRDDHARRQRSTPSSA